MSGVAIIVKVDEFCKLKLINYNVLLTMLLSIILALDQINAHILVF